ncbi:MAG: hypothetical protein FD138_3586 [Planctomycetota bacterium]|nr:MAG: hypothetical protein FD138_3586 [Planctomycetota bacterium]
MSQKHRTPILKQYLMKSRDELRPLLPSAALMPTTQVCVTRIDDLEGGKKAKIEGAVR